MPKATRRERKLVRGNAEAFFHFEPWLDNWRVRVPYVFRASPGAARVVVRDAIGRRSEVEVEGGVAALALTGAPVFIRGLDPAQFDPVSPTGGCASPRDDGTEISETSDEEAVLEDG